MTCAVVTTECMQVGENFDRNTQHKNGVVVTAFVSLLCFC